MEIKLILLQFCAHLLYDFILQGQHLSDQKRSKIFSIYHLYHFIIVVLFSYLFSLDSGFWKAAIAIGFFHLLTDMLKSRLIINNKSKNFFFIDQFIHIIFIIAIVLVYSHYSGINFIYHLEIKIIAVITGFILCAKPANVIIRNIFDVSRIKVPSEKDNNQDKDSLPNAGKLIGIAERFITLVLIMAGQYGAVGLILAAKSILRYNDIPKSEYVLIGTLLSFGIAIFTGVLINLIN